MKFHWDILGNGIAIAATIAQTDEVLRIIQIVLTCLGISVTLAYNIWKWVKAAKTGKIEDPKDIVKATTDLSNIVIDNIRKDLASKQSDTQDPDDN